MRIAVFETEEWEHDACLALQREHTVICTRVPLNRASVITYADAEVVSPFVNSRLDADVLAKLPLLKFIATRSTGFDHVDLAYCAARKITVSNVPNYGDSTVAEHAFALLLAVARNLVDAVERTRRGNFAQSGLRGFELQGKVIGVVGTGRIGKRVIAIAKGFGMRVVAADTRPDTECARALGFEYFDTKGVLAQSDVVSLHVPATPGTIGMVSDGAFALMKPGSVLINTSRGNVVDVAALVRALVDGRIGGAGLDVLPEEPLIREEAQIFRTGQAPAHDLKALVANHVLLRFPNVIVTPHIAYDTDGALRRIIDVTLANIRAFARGQPQNVVLDPFANR